MLASTIRCVALTGVALLCFCRSSSAAGAPTRAQCEQLGAQMTGHWPDSSTRLTAAQFFADPQPTKVSTPGAPPLEVVLPPHCEISGVLHERKGADGQLYAIHFHLRLPAVWNKRFYFQGGGGTNGEVGDALGALAGATTMVPR